MSIRRIRWLSLSASVLSVAAGLGLVAWSALAPVEIGATDGEIESPIHHSKAAAIRKPLSKDEFAAVAERKLQSPLFDPPPPPPPVVAPKPKPAPPPVKLLATMIEPSGNQAMLSDAKGAVRIVAVGDQVGGAPSTAQIIEIGQDKVVLKYEGELMTLQLTASP